MDVPDGILELGLGLFSRILAEVRGVFVDRLRDDVEVEALRRLRLLEHEEGEALGRGIPQPFLDGEASNTLNEFFLLDVDEWLTYASPESLSLFMYQKPKAAKKLFFDVIPKTVDEYLAYLAKYPSEEPKAKLENPIWHIHAGAPPQADLPISFALLLNLVSVSNAEDKATLWGFIRKYAAGATPQEHPVLDHLVGYALRYYHDFVKPAKTYRLPTEHERKALEALAAELAKVKSDASGEELQNIVYAVGKAHAFEPLRAWFSALYEVLLGQSQGPRFGGFIELYGVDNTRKLIERALKGELLAR